MVTPEAKQRMLTNVWRESYMRIYKTLEQVQTDRDLYKGQAERLANAMDWLLSSIIKHQVVCDHCEKMAREALEEYKLSL